MMISSRNDIPKLLKKYNCTVGVELGVATGKYSKYLLENHNFDASLFNDHPGKCELCENTFVPFTKLTTTRLLLENIFNHSIGVNVV